MKRSEIPSLDDLRAFEAVARLGSVRAAATELALTHGAVSRRVSKLSHDIDAKLVRPDGRGIQLTIDGEKLANATSGAFALLSTALTEIRAEMSGDQPIVLSCERSVAMRWLIPRLSAFQDENADVAVHLSVGGGALDFARDGVTLAIRRLDFPVDPNWTIEHLIDESVGPVMQPKMVESFLSGDYIALGSKTRKDGWPEWLGQHQDVKRPKEIRYMDHHFLMVEAAANGLGVAMCPKILAVDDIERDRLAAPLGFRKDNSEYGIIHPKMAGEHTTIIKLKTWLKEIGHHSN